MHKSDWSLMFFTLLSQFSVGVIFFLGLLYFVPGHSHEFSDGLSFYQSPEFIALLAIAGATLLSFLHLGVPAHAFNAMNNVKSSWLSREILGVILFGLGVLAIFILRVVIPANPGIQAAALVYSCVAGVFLIFVMSGIYKIVTVPSWNSWHTPFQFFMSALILGGMAMAGYLLKNPEYSNFVVIVLRILVALLMVQLIAAWLHQKHLLAIQSQSIENLDFGRGSHYAIYLIRLFIMFVSAMFLAYLSLRFRGMYEQFDAIFRFYTLIFAMLILGEFSGRYLFYGSYFRIGV